MIFYTGLAPNRLQNYGFAGRKKENQNGSGFTGLKDSQDLGSGFAGWIRIHWISRIWAGMGVRAPFERDRVETRSYG
jgi:hypothetical protein